MTDNKKIGEVQIANEVVASIAGISASEVEGVDSMAGGITNEIAGRLGMKNPAKGVKVEVKGDTAVVDLAIYLKYGYSIPKISAQVQEKVAQAINSMTGLKVRISMTRHDMRECMFCLLFQNEFYGTEEFAEQRDTFLEEKNLKPREQQEILERTSHLIQLLPEIDERISKCSKGWKLDRIAKAELAILRLAVYEAVYDEDVPVGVAVNEAVELAKEYGNDNGPSFVNGILGNIVNE